MRVFTDNTVGEQASGFQPEAARNPAIFNAENSHGENKSKTCYGVKACL